ncbi:MAG: cobalamin biosynthesis protein [Candidatus Obscuribacter sp.]|nr:cobalamin biosynthesis protein [Candidatus Melainabacteria bacterium]MDX1989598.1 cobalamin biosynthesis protein [Candidatus Obscuribacter sp.]
MQEKTAIWIVREEGERLAEELKDGLAEIRDLTLFRPWLADVKPIDQFRLNFDKFKSWIFIGTTGIAIRYMQGLLRDKKTDPCLVVIDEGGGFALSLAGGHEGGGNELAYQVAAQVQAVPVITTASESLKPLTVGIGCKKGTKRESIEAAIRQALGQRALSEIREIATISLKAKEPGLVEFCRLQAIPLRIFKEEDLAPRQWLTEKSAHVKKTLGLDGVCEPCALLASPRGKLLVPKSTGVYGVAVAVVEDERRKP